MFKDKKKVKINNQKINYFKVNKYSTKITIKITNKILSKKRFQNQKILVKHLILSLLNKIFLNN